MIYFAFTFWLFALLLTSKAIVKLWAGMVNPKIISWIILPGTIVGELAFYLASLICGADFRPRKLVSEDEGDEKADPGKATQGIPYLTPVMVGLLPVAAGMGLIMLLSVEFDHPVFHSFYSNSVKLPTRLPILTDMTVWTLLDSQVALMRDGWAALTDSLNNWPWENPKGWIFQYLMICLILRLAPPRRPMRPALIGTAVLAIGTALTVLIVSPKAQWLYDIWPLVSYSWATALLLLSITLCIRGSISLFDMFMGRE